MGLYVSPFEVFKLFSRKRGEDVFPPARYAVCGKSTRSTLIAFSTPSAGGLFFGR